MTYYSEKPSIFEPIGDGRYRYRWNIQSNIQLDIDEERVVWSCEEVFVPSPLNSNLIIENVLGYLWTTNYQLKMINEYNAALDGLYDENQSELIVQRYKDFLLARKMMKEHIMQDCINNNIK